VLGRLEQHLSRHDRTLAELRVIAPIGGPADAGTYRRLARRGVAGTFCAPWYLATPQEKARHGTGLDLKIATMQRFAADVIART
jgi:hypothetical protein